MGPEHKPPVDEGDPVGDGPSSVVTEAEAETPQAASIARSQADGERDAPPRGAWTWAAWSARVKTPRGRAVAAVIGGAVALLGAVVAAGLHRDHGAALPQVRAAALAGSIAGLEPVIDAGASDAGTDAVPDAAPEAPRVWRVAQLASDPSVGLVDVTVGRRPLLAALAAAGVSPYEATRIAGSLAAARGPEHPAPKDEVLVALDKKTKRAVAYELTHAPADVWQGREESAIDGSTALETRKLELSITRVRVRKAVLVGSDLHASFVDAGLAPIDDLLPMLDDALDGHAELSNIRPGSRLRIVATQDQADGAFVRWVSLEAVEYFPATAGAPAVRVYRFGEAEDGGKDGKRRHGWYDAKGRQPLHGGWRTPVPLARISSRFNPHRMHPILHVVMPHTGVDFAAPVGTPVYATAAGTVISVGKAGPCGNMVQLSHPGNVVSVYCHLSRFAAGLRVGQHVEQRQVIAYVGQTGRVTGPHLHFGIRRNGVVIDPMSLRLDGVRVVPRARRDEFDRLRSSLDAELDGIALPAGGAPAPEPAQAESFYEEP